MPSLWEPGTQYDYGAVVSYEGHNYKIIQPHRSQGDWSPPVTPALWGRMQDGDNGNQGGGYGGNQGGYGNNQGSNQGGYGSSQGSYGNTQGGYGQQQQQWQPLPTVDHNDHGGYQKPQDQKVDIPHEEQKKNWYDLDDKRKNELLMGGGLLAGAGLLAGGFTAYKMHEKSEEEKNAQTWGMQGWLRDAQGRTETCNRQGFGRDGCGWVLASGKNIPPNAIVVGTEKDWKLCVCRAFQDGGVQIGKASNVFKKGAVLGYKNDEIHVDTYEILVGDPNAITWVQMSGRFNRNSLNGRRPIEGGRENDGTPLFVCRAPHKGAVHPGKCSEKLEGAFIPYDGHEKCVGQYEVACFAH